MCIDETYRPCQDSLIALRVPIDTISGDHPRWFCHGDNDHVTQGCVEGLSDIGLLQKDSGVKTLHCARATVS